MEGIFFVTPIWWIFPVSGLSIMTALFGGVFIGVAIVYYLSKRNLKSEIILQKPIFQLVDSTDPEYAIKTLREIRKYLSNTYYPMHSWAHIPMNIKSYTMDKELIAIIEQLEQIEFSGIIPEHTIIESIHQILSKKLSS